jgi:tetratricopeptide (TPR) repeat protein
MVNHARDGSRRTKLRGVSKKTAAYLRKIERYAFDPIRLRCPDQSGPDSFSQNQAERVLLTVRKSTPESPEAYKYLGVLYLEQGEFERAEQHFKMSRMTGTNPDVLTLLGVARFRLDKILPARRAYRRAIATDSNYKEAYYNLALTFRHKKALRLFQKAVELDPKYAAAHRELGWELKRARQYPDAETYIKRAIKLDETDSWAYIYLGNLMWRIAKHKDAEQAYKTAIKACPKAGTPYWCLADFYKYQGRHKEAKGLYKKATLLDPDSSVAHFRLGLYLKQLGESVTAKRHLERALRLDPDFESVKTALDELNREGRLNKRGKV